MSVNTPNIHGVSDSELRAQVRDLAVELIELHLAGTGWSFGFDQAVKRFGQCSFSKRRITVSFVLCRVNTMEEIRDTLLHEIAHALAGPSNGHNHVWKRIARSIGCSGTTTATEGKLDEASLPWKGTCPNGHTVHRARAPQRDSSCNRCSPRYSTDHLFTWVGPGGKTPAGPAWTGTCPAGHVTTRARKPKQLSSCPQCAPYFSRAHLITWAGRNGETLGLGNTARIVRARAHAYS